MITATYSGLGDSQGGYTDDEKCDLITLMKNQVSLFLPKDRIPSNHLEELRIYYLNGYGSIYWIYSLFKSFIMKKLFCWNEFGKNFALRIYLSKSRQIQSWGEMRALVSLLNLKIKTETKGI